MNQIILNLIHHPLSISSQDLFNIEDEIEKYPYFQPLHLLKAKAVSKSDEPKFLPVLSKTSTFCSNRIILFEYLNKEILDNHKDAAPQSSNSKQDSSTEKSQHAESSEDIQDLIKLKQAKVQASQVENPNGQEDQVENLLTTHQRIQEDKGDTEKRQTETFEEKDDTKATAASRSSGKHLFNQWLNINQQDEPKEIVKKEKESVVNEKFKVIEEFLDKNPKIVPSKEYKPSIEIQSNPKENLSHLMTETLAKIYLDQNKYDKAIKAYTILRLKYPEKSGYFADQIKEIQELKHK